MLESARTRSTASGSGSVGSSGVFVPRMGRNGSSGSAGGAEGARGWDWRGGLPEDARGEDVLRMLRVGLAGGLSLSGLG